MEIPQALVPSGVIIFLADSSLLKLLCNDTTCIALGLWLELRSNV